jgi:cyclopropane-fatty-acyl-phospholipid synthase
MTYSSAWFEPGDDLQGAQLRKIDGILDLARVRPGMRVLEIGSGWGALAIRAARERGAHVTTLTLSTEQQALARKRAEEAGVADRVDVRLQDYREATGQYDAVVSVEMIEAVGERFWPTYFTALDKLLAPGGRVGLQAITMAHEQMLATRRGYTWIHKYVFPGGIIPSLRAIEDNLAAHTGLSVVERRELGPHYARTLQLWRERFLANWGGVSDSFDETFRRMWEFYLAYSEAGFRAGYLDDVQLLLTKR